MANNPNVGHAALVGVEKLKPLVQSLIARVGQLEAKLADSGVRIDARAERQIAAVVTRAMSQGNARRETEAATARAAAEAEAEQREAEHQEAEAEREDAERARYRVTQAGLVVDDEFTLPWSLVSVAVEECREALERKRSLAVSVDKSLVDPIVLAFDSVPTGMGTARVTADGIEIRARRWEGFVPREVLSDADNHCPADRYSSKYNKACRIVSSGRVVFEGPSDRTTYGDE